MQVAIIVLKRSVSMPKHTWRLASTRRTLDPIALGPLVEQALRACPGGWASPILIEAGIAQSGAALEPPLLRTANRRDWAGVFEVNWSEDQVKLRLNQEACRREVHTPRRPTQHIATLQGWEPVRVLLNGKADWPSGRYYFLQDYHIVLCGQIRQPLLPTRTRDLQADLL